MKTKRQTRQQLQPHQPASVPMATYSDDFHRFDNTLKAAIADGRLTLKERAVVLSVATRPVLQSMADWVLEAPNVTAAYSRHVLGRQTGGYNGTLVSQPLPTDAGGSVGLSDYGGGQGLYGTCVVLATAMGNLNYRVNPNGTTSFRFYDKDTWQPRWITVENKRAIEGSDGLLGVAEVAYGVWAQVDSLSSPHQGWNEVTDGNPVGQVMFAMTGRPPSVVSAPTALRVTNAFNRGESVVLSTTGEGVYTASHHAYRVTGVTDSHVTFLNPWMTDGRTPTGDPYDGFITLDRQTFNQEFSTGFAHHG